MEEDIYLFYKVIYVLRVWERRYSESYTKNDVAYIVGAFKTDSAAEVYFQENYDVNKY